MSYQYSVPLASVTLPRPVDSVIGFSPQTMALSYTVRLSATVRSTTGLAPERGMGVRNGADEALSGRGRQAVWASVSALS